MRITFSDTVIEKSGNYGSALKHYNLALQINPRHKGAHEYIAYLEVGNLPTAELHLKTLDNICTFGCEEHRQLKQAVCGIQEKHNICG